MGCHWQNKLSAFENLEHFKTVVKKWKKDIYGNIFARKRKLVNEVKKVQKILEF